MTLRTGTSNTGKEYRYYTCATKARQGVKGCPGITAPMDRLNDAVIAIEKRLLEPARLEALMDQILERRDDWVAQRRLHVADLERRATEAEAKLKRLYEAIENGVLDMSDPSLKDRIAELAATRDQARGDADRAVSHIEKIGPTIHAGKPSGIRKGGPEEAAQQRWVVRTRPYPRRRAASRSHQQDRGPHSRSAQRIAANLDRRLWRRGGGARRSWF